jgi:hypothetical protein
MKTHNTTKKIPAQVFSEERKHLTPVFEFTHGFFFLGVNGQHRQTTAKEVLHLVVDVTETGRFCPDAATFCKVPDRPPARAGRGSLQYQKAG